MSQPTKSSSTAEPSLLYREDGDVATITLNRPSVVNALSIELSERLVEAIERVRKARHIKILVIRGAGGNFCAGDDLKEIPSWGNADDFFYRVRYYQNMANQLEELDKVTIAAVDGIAVGGGLEITMACDFVIATARSTWGMPEIDTGITPGWGGTTRMARLIGRRWTKEINMIGALHPARRAVQIGLWNRVVADGKLDAAVNEMVDMLHTKNMQTMRQMKFIINKGVEADLYTAQGFEVLSSSLAAAINGWWKVPDADSGSGLQNFKEKGDTWKKRRGAAKNFWVNDRGEG